MTSKYETLVLVDPALGEQDTPKFLKKLEELVLQHKGRLLTHENLGRKKLAYPIKKKREGSYIRLDLEMPTSALALFQRGLRLEPNVLREMTVRL